MREFKFRAWDKKNKKWVYDFNIDSCVGIFRISCFETIEVYDDIEIMQYVGLKDINGRMIFEGDIVQIPDNFEIYGFNAGEKYQIYFSFGGFRLKPKYDKKKKSKGFWLKDDKTLEIIGNIFENPELLEKTK
jgi:uncharacterized phage protein (TIGR01671 family)